MKKINTFLLMIIFTLNIFSLSSCKSQEAREKENIEMLLNYAEKNMIKNLK